MSWHGVGHRAVPVRVLAPLLVAVSALVAGCTLSGTGPTSAKTTTSPTTATSIVGTSTNFSTVTTTLGTLTVPVTDLTTVTATASTVGPPPSTTEPPPKPGSCPYLSDEDVKNANGQHTGQTSIVDVEPYPVCIFTRSDGGYMATTRIVVAKSAAAAAAAVDQHVPRQKSNPATLPGGWTGGAMGNLDGVEDYPDAKSIYAVSKGKTAVIAISNQAQSIKGRQMAEQIVANLDK